MLQASMNDFVTVIDPSVLSAYIFKFTVFHSYYVCRLQYVRIMIW